jgi:uncharacterized lipoprotein YmbA
MKKLFFFTLLIFLSSCSPKIIPEKTISYYSVDVQKVELKNKNSVNLMSVDGIDYLLTKKIAYRENYKWGYFQKGEWICSPDCMLTKNLLKNLPYLSENSDNKLYIKILDFYVDFQPDSAYSVASFQVSLKKGKDEYSKVFNYKVKTKNSIKDIVKGFDEALQYFIKDLDSWLSEKL